MRAVPKLAILGVAAALATLPAALAYPQSCPLSCGAPPPLGAPGGDNPDDAASVASPAAVLPGASATPEFTPGLRYARARTVVVVNGFWERMLAFLQMSGTEAATVPLEGLGDVSPQAFPTLALPSGSLAGSEGSEQVRVALADYVSRGGSLLVFAQQRGIDFAVLPTPDGRPIHGYGWFEDNSCYTNGAYVETFHPILASQPGALVTSNIDGYFDSIPDSATVLLRRVKNGLPAMFMYPYGQGWVIVTSSYDDWGGFNQDPEFNTPLPGARDVIVDAVTWAKKPADLPINAPGSSTSVTVAVKNETALPASQVRLVLMSPSRDRLVTEQTVSLALPAGGSAETEFTYAFPADAELGIYHVDYELLDQAGVTVQPVAEEDSGRIVLATPPTSQYRPSDLSVSVTLPDGELAVAGTPVRFHYRVINRSTSERHIRTYWNLGWDAPAPADDLIIPGQSSVDRDVVVTAPYTRASFQLHVYEEGGTPKPPTRFYRPIQGETGAFQLIDVKVFTVVNPWATVSATADRPIYLAGQTANLTISLVNGIELPWSGTVEVQELGTGAVVAQAPFSFDSGGTATATASVTVPDAWYSADYSVSVKYQGLQRGSAAVGLLVGTPDLRAVSLSLPTWSRSSPNTVSWTLTNPRPVPLQAGTLSGSLLCFGSGVVWQASQPIALAEAPQGQGTFSLEVPAIASGWTNCLLTLSAESGFGRRIEERISIRSSLAASVSLSALDFEAGSSGELLLTLRNSGGLREEGTASGSINGIGGLPSQAYALDPGAETLLRFGFDVPVAGLAGLRLGSIQLGTGPPLYFTVPIRPMKLEFVVEDRVYAVGESMPILVRNLGGRGTADVSVDFEGLAQAQEILALESGGEATLSLAIPASLRTGIYPLTGSAVERASGSRAGLYKILSVSGLEAAACPTRPKPPRTRTVLPRRSMIQTATCEPKDTLPAPPQEAGRGSSMAAGPALARTRAWPVAAGRMAAAFSTLRRSLTPTTKRHLVAIVPVTAETGQPPEGQGLDSAPAWKPTERSVGDRSV